MVKRFLSKVMDCRGSVMMEYVLIAVLIAAVCLIAVIVFSRSVGGGFITTSRAVSGDHTQAAEKQSKQQEDRNRDAEKARTYSESLSK